MNAKVILMNIFRWLLLLFLQIFLLRNMSFYNFPSPFLYTLFLLLLPFRISNFLLYILAFGTGIILDSFYDTLGVHTSACVVLAFVRILFINISLSRESLDGPSPTLGNMGFKWFSLYTLICIFAHHLILFFLEAFKLSSLGYTLGRAIMSLIFTVFLIFLTEFTFQSKKTTA